MPPDDVNEVVNKAFKDKFQVPETSLIKKGGNPISSLRFKRITYQDRKIIQKYVHKLDIIYTFYYLIFCKHPASNDTQEIIGFRKVGRKLNYNQENEDQVSEDVVIAELFHGPTLAFKVVVSLL